MGIKGPPLFTVYEQYISNVLLNTNNFCLLSSYTHAHVLTWYSVLILHSHSILFVSNQNKKTYGKCNKTNVKPFTG